MERKINSQVLEGGLERSEIINVSCNVDRPKRASLKDVKIQLPWTGRPTKKSSNYFCLE